MTSGGNREPLDPSRYKYANTRSDQIDRPTYNSLIRRAAQKRIGRDGYDMPDGGYVSDWQEKARRPEYSGRNVSSDVIQQYSVFGFKAQDTVHHTVPPKGEFDRLDRCPTTCLVLTNRDMEIPPNSYGWSVPIDHWRPWKLRFNAGADEPQVGDIAGPDPATFAMSKDFPGWVCISSTQTIDGIDIKWFMKACGVCCSEGKPGELIEGTVVGTVPPSAEGDVEVEVNGLTQTKKFLHDCDPELEDATLEDGDKIDLFINDCCKLIYLNCGTPGECDDCPDIIWCCCGECDQSAGGGGKELIEATSASCSKLGGTNLGLIDEVPESEARELCDAECTGVCEDGEPKICCNPETGECESDVCEEDCEGRSFDTLEECQRCCCECECSGISDNQDLLNQTITNSRSGIPPNIVQVGETTSQTGSFTLCPGEIEGAKGTWTFNANASVNIPVISFIDSGTSSTSAQLSGVANNSTRSGVSGNSSPFGTFIGTGTSSSHVTSITTNGNSNSDSQTDGESLPQQGSPFSYQGTTSQSMTIEVEYYTLIGPDFKCFCGRVSVWRRITVTYENKSSGTRTDSNGQTKDFETNVSNSYSTDQWFAYRGNCRFEIPSFFINAGYGGLGLTDSGTATATASGVITFPNAAGAPSCSQVVNLTSRSVGGKVIEEKTDTGLVVMKKSNVGTNLTKILKSYGAKPCERCNRTAAKMDQMTIEEIEENFDELVKEIYGNIRKLSFWQKAKAAATALRHGLTIDLLLRRAIEEPKE